MILYIMMNDYIAIHNPVSNIIIRKENKTNKYYLSCWHILKSQFKCKNMLILKSKL